MQHEKAVIKKSIKRYKTVNGVEKESISFSAKIGVNSNFNNGDNVVIIPADEYDAINNIDVGEIQLLKNDVAGKDEIITANNKTIAKLNAELKSQLNLMNDESDKLKASEKTVADLRDDISKKDKIISELESKLNVANATVDNVTAERDSIYSKLDELSDILTTKNSIIDNLDDNINELEKEIAVLNATDISELKDKAKELDKSKNIIIKLQNERTEYIQLVAFKDKKIDALENKGVLDYILKRNVTADIDSPTLLFIDSSGNPIKENDAELVVDKITESDNDDTTVDDKSDNDDSGDTIILI